MDCLNSETMKAYFDLFKDVLGKNKLMESLAQIYNVGRMGMPLDYRASPQVDRKERPKKIRYRTGNKCQISVMACLRAAGQAIPTFCYF